MSDDRTNNGTMALMIAASLTQEQLVDMLDASIKKYQSDKTSDNYELLETACSLLLAKNIAPTAEDAIKMAKKMEDHYRMDDLMNPDKSKSN